MEAFKLGTPKLICRWRLSGGRLPLENRHMRALAARRIDGEAVSAPLVAWAKQHVEWTLTEGSQPHPDGVLMLVIDDEGQAAMTLGAYTGLQRTTVNDLLVRARSAQREADVTGVSPEDIWALCGDTLLWGTSMGGVVAGSSSLIHDLACTLGMSVHRDDELVDRLTLTGVTRDVDEVFLVSDEHGVVPASDRGGMRAQKFQQSYDKLLQAYAKRGRASLS